MKYHTFQRNAVRKWNPNYDEVCSLIVPKVMLHDEISTDGYGKCIIELLTLHGILDKCKSGENNYEWRLSTEWQKKKIILCLDGLSLDRHRGFCNKLLKLPISFTNAYKQSQIFQKALTRVIDISGPLHTSFHILQSVYIVYGCLLKSVQHCLGWKKINHSKVSDNYRLCVHMVDIVYEETFRVLFFNFLLEYTAQETYYREESIDELVAIDLCRKFHKYVERKCQETTDERFKLLVCFFNLVNVFKRYELAMKSGDSIEMEYIENSFCGVFLLLDKNNYVEILLSQMEKKYGKISLTDLQEIRINSSARYNKDSENGNKIDSLHVLDELMENVNMWVKALPLNDDQESWVVHSPNVMVARKCLLFEKAEYKRGLLDFEHLVKTGNITERQYDRSGYVQPRKIIEKQRVFEFLMLYVGNEVEQRKSSGTEMYACTEKLTTTLESINTDTSVSCDIDNDLDLIFESINELRNNAREKDNADTDIDGSTNEDDTDSKQNNNINSENIKHHKYAMTNIMLLAKQEMIKKDYITTRKKKKERMKRHEDFIQSLYESLILPDNKKQVELSWLKECTPTSLQCEMPSFTEHFESLKSKNVN